MFTLKGREKRRFSDPLACHLTCRSIDNRVRVDRLIKSYFFLFLFPLSSAMSFDLREFVAGGVSGGVGVVVGQPLSLVILRMQTAGLFLIRRITS